jgi:UDP-2,3-diacylglucosamine pyrophosphatase LpxH
MTLLLSDRVAVISDLHVGDPGNTRLDDFLLDAAFEQLLRDVVPPRSSLIIAGDFLDFAQTMPELGRHDLGDRYGTTEDESVTKVRAIVEGHPRVFDALARFAASGQVLLLPGNHDIDLHWPRVLDYLRHRLGASPDHLAFVAEGTVHERGLYVEHGNQYSFDNRFDHWAQPILPCDAGPPRLERPWGTLFMDLVYSDLKDVYPFINKLWPHGKLAAIALRSYGDDERIGISAVVELVVFLLTKGKQFLWGRLLGDAPHGTADSDIAMLLDQLRLSAARRSSVEAAVHARLASSSADAHSEPLAGLLGHTDQRGLEDRAVELLRSGVAAIVSFGHTHEPIDGNVAPRWGDTDPRRSFNTGSWVPQLDLAAHSDLRVSDLIERSADPAHLAVAPRWLDVELGGVPRAWLRPVPGSLRA